MKQVASLPFGLGAILLVGTVALHGASSSSPSDPTFQAMQEACVQVIENRLAVSGKIEVLAWTKLERRPATELEVLGRTPNEALLRDDYSMAWVQYNSRKKRLAEANGKAERLVTYLSFTTKAGGAKVKLPAAECAYVAIGNDAPVTIDPRVIKVDGFTSDEFRHLQGM